MNAQEITTTNELHAATLAFNEAVEVWQSKSRSPFRQEEGDIYLAAAVADVRRKEKELAEITAAVAAKKSWSTLLKEHTQSFAAPVANEVATWSTLLNGRPRQSAKRKRVLC